MTPDTITQIPLVDLYESRFNPRRLYAGLEALAANILAEGRIHEPLLVRPRIVNSLRPDEHSGYEIVFGHRRLRAADLTRLVMDCALVGNVHIRNSYASGDKPEALLLAAKHYGVAIDAASTPPPAARAPKGAKAPRTAQAGAEAVPDEVV